VAYTRALIALVANRAVELAEIHLAADGGERSHVMLLGIMVILTLGEFWLPADPASLYGYGLCHNELP
jgi:hypothetical protein